MRLLKQLKSSYNKRSGLPRGFTEVEYLESNANAYIRTNIYPTDEYGYKIINTYTIGAGEQCAIGCMDSGNRFVGIYSAGNANQLSGAWGAFVGFLSITTTWDNNTIYVVECNYKNSRKIIWNGSELKDIANEHITGTISRPLVLFGRDSGSITGIKGKIYKVIITKGTDIVNVFIPCLDQENTPCMYDIINKQAYYNVGSGNFTYGKKIYSIEYLESSGTQYIDTGYIPSNTTGQYAKMQYTTVNNGVTFGSMVSGNGTVGPYYATSSGSYWWIRWGTNEQKIEASSPTTSDIYELYLNFNNDRVAKANDIIISDSLGNISGNYPSLTLFRRNFSAGYGYLSGKIYKYQITENNTLIHDYYPVRDENDVGYMYDKITHRLFANAGTGSFVLGSEAEQYDNTSKIAFVEEYKGKLPRKYTEVEYLESTGTQYINTGLLSTVQSKVDVVFSFSSMESGTVNNAGVFGGRNNSTNTTFTLFKIATGSPQYFRFDYNGQPQVATADQLTWNTASKYRFQYDGTNSITTNTTTGESFVKAISPASTFTTNPICLFAVNTNDTISTYMSGRIYKYWYTDGTTTIDLIPVLDETGKPCMYDRISGNVYYNQGTGDDFIAGPKIRQVEYLESTGEQYIDTGYVLSSDCRGEALAEYTGAPSTGSSYIFGTYDGGKNFGVNTSLHSPGQDTLFYFVWANVARVNVTGDPLPALNTKYHVTVSRTLFKVNNSSITYDGATFTGSNSAYLFWANGTGQPKSLMKLYWTKFWDGNGTLVRDYIPVIDENNIGYMFDKVTHTLYANAGTGSFTHGNLVRQYTLRLFRERDDIPTTYKKVSYLQSTGTQYIDTGLKGKNGYDFDFKFNSKINDTAYGIGGEWQGGNSCYLGVIRNNNKFAYHYKNTQSPVEIQTLVNDTDYEVQAHLYSSEQYYVTNGTKSTVGTISGDFTSTENIWLFAINASTVTYSNLKMYYMKIWDNGTLTRDFVPVIRKSDNKPGMWDKVTRTFYTNAGSGEFNYGE